MQNPKMILFDCGHTLIYAPEFDPARGTAELMKYAVRNPHGYTVEDVRKLSDEVFSDHFETVRRLGYETSAQAGDRIVYQTLGIEFDLTPVEMETVFWNAAGPGLSHARRRQNDRIHQQRRNTQRSHKQSDFFRRGIDRQDKSLFSAE